jgi:hypothetical protein
MFAESSRALRAWVTAGGGVWTMWVSPMIGVSGWVAAIRSLVEHTVVEAVDSRGPARRGMVALPM